MGHRQTVNRQGEGGVGMPAIGHLLVVAAPAGAGKSTFLAQLRSGELPAAIRAKLPPSVEHWAQLEANAGQPFLSALSDAERRTSIPGLAFHYDTTCKWVWYGHDSREDPLKQLLELAQKVTIVNLRPSAERLTRQLSQRELKMRGSHVLRGRKFVWKVGETIRTAARSLLSGAARFVPPVWIESAKQSPSLLWMSKNLRAPTQKSSWVKIAHYERQEWLDELHARWQAHLRSLAGSVRYEQIDLEPDPSAPPGAHYCWFPYKQRQPQP
jgi:hypothetical protein